MPNPLKYAYHVQNLPLDCSFQLPCNFDCVISYPSTICGFSTHLKYEVHFSANWLFQPAQLARHTGSSSLPLRAAYNLCYQFCYVRAQKQVVHLEIQANTLQRVFFFSVQGIGKNSISWTVSVDAIPWLHLFHWFPAKGLDPDKLEGNSDRAFAKEAERWGMWMVRRSLYWR